MAIGGIVAKAKQALGKLPNAPLAYALAQIRISTFMEMQDHIADIHKHLRCLFRGRRDSEARLIQLFPEPKVQPIKRWEFYDLDNRQGAVIQTNSIVFHTTTYEDSDAFMAHLKIVLEAVAEALPDMLIVERLGMRYIDVILPNDGEHPNDYVVEGLRGLTPVDPDKPEPGVIDLNHSIYAATYQCARGMMNFRYSVLPRGSEPLPDELQPLVLDPSPILQRARQAQRLIGTLDTDHYIEERSEFNPESLIMTLSEMRRDISTMFRAVGSRLAWSVWRTANNE